MLKLPHLSTWDALLGNAFTYLKFAILIISVMCDTIMFSIYLICIIVLALLVNQPEFDGASLCIDLTLDDFLHLVERKYDDSDNDDETESDEKCQQKR